MKMRAKDLGLAVVMGSGVIVLTPIVAGFVSGIELMATEIIPGMLTLGTAVAAGLSAFVADLAITKWLK